MLALVISPTKAAVEKTWPWRWGRGAGSCPAGKRTRGGRSLHHPPADCRHLPSSQRPVEAAGELGLEQDAQWGLFPRPRRPCMLPPAAAPLLTPPCRAFTPQRRSDLRGLTQGPRETERPSEPPPGRGRPWSEPSPRSHLSQVHGE